MAKPDGCEFGFYFPEVIYPLTLRINVTFVMGEGEVEGECGKCGLTKSNANRNRCSRIRTEIVGLGEQGEVIQKQQS